MKWSDYSPWLKGEFLGGKDYTLTVRAVEVEITHPQGKPVKTPVLYFQETKKGLPLSPTNRLTLARLFGDEATGCIGKRVTLRAVPTTVAGRDLLPVRIFQTPADATKNGGG